MNDRPVNIVLINTNTPVSTPVNSVIGDLQATDEDAGDSHTFSLVTGDGINDSDNGKFYIEGNQLKNNSTLVFLDDSEYHILVRAEDTGGEAVIVPIIVGAHDQGNPPHNITLSNTLVLGIDDPPVFVGIIEAEDLDQDGGHVFTLQENSEFGPDNGYFTIVNNALYLSTPQLVTEKSIYEILLAATDAKDNQFAKAFLIHVKDQP